MMAAARADGPPSRLVRAPITELEKLTALDSDQAMCSLKRGRFPARYGVQVAVMTIPMALKASMILIWLRAKSSGKPISIHHMDAYRLTGGGDFDDHGGLDLLGDDTVLIIEWADRVASGLPKNHIHVSMEHVDPETRKITMQENPT